MSAPRFISDLHLGHKSMAQGIRGFQDEFYHDEFLIDTWNSVVKSPKNLVFIGGDITMEKGNYDILDRLIGRKVVIGGNHDLKQHTRLLLEHVESVVGCLDYKGYIVTHVPIHELELAFCRGNIHGHTHTRMIDNDRYFNVCAEVLNYKPHTLEELIERYKK